MHREDNERHMNQALETSGLRILTKHRWLLPQLMLLHIPRFMISEAPQISTWNKAFQFGHMSRHLRELAGRHVSSQKQANGSLLEESILADLCRLYRGQDASDSRSSTRHRVT